jgi:branched-chain amino acid transport system permease protein
MAIIRTKTQWVLFSLFMLALFTLPFYLPSSWFDIVNSIGIILIAVTGLNILMGYCGQLSLGQAGFMAVGAFTSAILSQSLHMPFLVSMVCSGLSAGLIGLIFGIPSLRVKGFYLAISTIAAQFIIIWVLKNWTDVTHGANGLDVAQASVGSFVFDSEVKQFFLIFSVAAISVLFAINLARGRIGRAFIAVRDNDLAAAVMGINIFNYKLLGFFLGCFFAGIAGALYAQYKGHISYEDFTFQQSILYIGMLIIGGLGSSIGPIFGTVIIETLQKMLTNWVAPWLEQTINFLPTGFSSGLNLMIFGLAFILILIFQPKGIAHMWSLFKGSYRLWPFSY